MRASTAAPAELKKTVWVWTENRQVMKAAVERGWSTFLFGSKDLGEDWSCENNYFLLSQVHNIMFFAGSTTR